MCNVFRTLRADEIEVRVQQIKKNNAGKVYAQLLLYKDARVDMTLLDEQFGILGWQREHTFKEGKNYCKVSVYDKEHGIWVVKEDVGTPSNTEADKGHASDAFKRACVNLGIGRELYSAPRIVIEVGQGEYYTQKDNRGNDVCRLSNNVAFLVNAITYDARRNIVGLEIVDKTGRTRTKIGEVHDPIYTAVGEMNNVRSLAECRAIWNKYPEHQDEPRFVAATNQKKSTLTKS